MLVLGETREMLVGLCREISRFSRDLVGRAVVLDGGALGSEAWDPQLFLPGKLLGRGRGECLLVPRDVLCQLSLVLKGIY